MAQANKQTPQAADPSEYSLHPYFTPLPRLQLSLDDCALALGMPVTTLEKMRRCGEAPLFFRCGRQLFTTTQLVAEWQAEMIADAKKAGAGQ